MVLFKISCHKHRMHKPAKWLITSNDADQPMIILLAMATSEPPAVHTRDDPGVIKVTVKRVAQGHPSYLNVNQVSEATYALRDGSESAWPPVKNCTRLDNQWKVCFFVVACMPCLGVTSCSHQGYGVPKALEIYPLVTVTNIGGRRSERDVRWAPLGNGTQGRRATVVVIETPKRSLRCERRNRSTVSRRSTSQCRGFRQTLCVAV